MGSKSNRSGRYSEEFKRDAVAPVRSSGRTVTEVARGLGVSAEGLRNWVRQDRADRGQGAPGELMTAEREELRRLRRQNREQAGTIEVLRKAAGLLREGERSMTAVYAFIEAEKTTHTVAVLCRLLNVARSSFYAWQAAAKARAARKAADEALAHEITVIHVASRHTYGVPRIHAELRRLGRAVNRKRVARVRREPGIQGAHRRRRRSLTRPDKRARPAPDLIGRDFHAERPGTKLVGDITSPASPPPRAGSTSPAGWTWPPARSSDTRWPPITAPPSSSTP